MARRKTAKEQSAGTDTCFRQGSQVACGSRHGQEQDLSEEGTSKFPVTGVPVCLCCPIAPSAAEPVAFQIPTTMKNRIAVKALVAFGLLAGALAPNSGAAVPIRPNSNLQIGGSFSQGYLKTDGNNYPFPAGDGTFDFREMGLNASTTFGTRMSAPGRRFSPSASVTTARTKPCSIGPCSTITSAREVGVRVGRIKYPRGLYGEVLDLDVVRPFVFLPLTQYSPVLRDFSASFDGAMLYGSLNLRSRRILDYKVLLRRHPGRSPVQGVLRLHAQHGHLQDQPGHHRHERRLRDGRRPSTGTRRSPGSSCTSDYLLPRAT